MLYKTKFTLTLWSCLKPSYFCLAQSLLVVGWVCCCVDSPSAGPNLSSRPRLATHTHRLETTMAAPDVPVNSGNWTSNYRFTLQMWWNNRHVLSLCLCCSSTSPNVSWVKGHYDFGDGLFLWTFRAPSPTKRKERSDDKTKERSKERSGAKHGAEKDRGRDKTRKRRSASTGSRLAGFHFR